MNGDRGTFCDLHLPPIHLVTTEEALTLLVNPVSPTASDDQLLAGNASKHETRLKPLKGAAPVLDTYKILATSKCIASRRLV